MTTIEQSLAASADLLARRMAFWANNKAELTPMIAHATILWPEIEFSVSPTGLDISLVGSMGDLLGLLSNLEKDGYAVSNELPEESKTYWSTYLNKVGSPQLWVYWSNKFCERVQVGTRMVEEPVYEVRCTEA